MKKIFILLSLVTAFSEAQSATPTPEQCLRSFAKNYVPEYNSHNDYILSKSKKDMDGLIDVLISQTTTDWIVKFSKSNLSTADAVGLVFNYDDEVHLIYTSINVVNDKCQVKELADINTVDIAYDTVKGSNVEDLLPKYFLGKTKKELPGHAKNWLYDEVKKSIQGDE